MGGEEITDPARGYTSASYALSGKIMLSAIVILLTVVLLIICLHIYARCFLIRARRRNNSPRRRTHRRTTHVVFISDTAPSQPLSSSVTNNNNPVIISRGLEPAVLKSLPTFIYSSTANKTTQDDEAVEEEEVLECAVCLSEFEENEKGRLLPKCNHSFHINCIDMWFHTHSTCPICRAPVNDPQISQPEVTEIPSIQIVIDTAESEPEYSSSSTGPCPSCQHEEIVNGGVPSSSSSSSSSTSSSSSSGLNPSLSVVGARRKISEMVGVSIEVPRREESFRNMGGEEMQGSPGSQGYKSPGSRILSLKRILSREKKPCSIPSLSFCGSVSEIDPEKGVEEEEEEEEAQSPAVQVNR